MEMKKKTKKHISSVILLLLCISCIVTSIIRFTNGVDVTVSFMLACIFAVLTVRNCRIDCSE